MDFSSTRLWKMFESIFLSLLSIFSWNEKNQKRYLTPPLKHYINLFCCKNCVVTELWLSSLWRTSKSFTFAESHFEINIWEAWREIFPYVILTLGVPFGLLAAAFVMISRDLILPAWVSHLRVEPLREHEKIFHHLNLCHAGAPGGFLEA